MTFMLCLSILFAALALYKPHRYEWSVLALLMFLSWVNTTIYVVNDVERYFIRAVLTTLAGLALMLKRSDLSVYHAVILLFTLVAYGALAFDVSQGVHVLIYNYYEAVIYGLVIFQLFGVYPTLRASYSDWVTGREPRLVNNQMGERK